VRFLSMVGGFAASVLGARLLGAEGMGAVATALTIAMLGAVILSGGLGLAAIYYLSGRSGDPATAVGRILVLGGIAIVLDLVVIWVLGVALSATEPIAGSALIMAAPLSAAILAFDLGGAIMLGLAAEHAYIWIQVAEALLGLVVTALVLVFVAATPAGFVFATLLGYIGGAVLAVAMIRRRVGSIVLGWDSSFARQLLRFGVRGQIGNVMSFLNTRLDLLLVSGLVGLTAAGLYYVAVRISEAVLLVAQAGGTLLYPRVAAQADRRATHTTEALVRATLVVVGLGALGVVLLGEPFIEVVFGKSFGEASWAARIVALSMLPFALHRLLAGDLRGRGRPGLVSASSGIALVATVVLDVALIPPFGIAGAAVASLIAYSIAAGAMLVLFVRATGMSARDLIPTWRDVVVLARRGVGMLYVLRVAARSAAGRGAHALTPRRTRVVALGYQGFGNLGDEAILGGIEELLRHAAVDVATLVGGPAPIAAFPSAGRIVSRRLLPSPRSLRALASSDSVLMTGGGLLHDHFPIVLPRYLAWTLAARLLRCRVVWVGVGVGPLRRRVSRWLAGLILRLSHGVFVRDQASATLVRAIGARVDGVMPDPALFLPPPDSSPEPPGPPELAVVVRAPIVNGSAEDQLHLVLVELLTGAAAAGRQASILTFAGERDRAFATRVATEVGRGGLPRPTIEELLPDHRAGLARIARAGLIVTVRLHGMILAAVAGRPFVAVAYDQKVRGVAIELDAADQVVGLESLTTAALDAAIERAGDGAARLRIGTRLTELRDRRASLSAAIERALRGSP
jgi:polysaccharide pyruvyl transferase CsaB